jgi:hypothetical protein
MNTIDLPEAGEAVTLAFDLDAMEAIHDEYGETYVQEVFRRLDMFDPTAIRLCLSNMASAEVSISDLMEKMTVQDLVWRIMDAIHLALKGEKISTAKADEAAAA